LSENERKKFDELNRLRNWRQEKNPLRMDES